MPTISNSRLAPASRPKCLPIGSSFLKNFRANASLMTATCREVAVSCSEMPRPLTIGVPMTSKYPAVTRSQQASCRPSARERDVHPPRRRYPNRCRFAASICREPRKIRRECLLSNRGCAGKAARVGLAGNRQAVDSCSPRCAGPDRIRNPDSPDRAARR